MGNSFGVVQSCILILPPSLQRVPLSKPDPSGPGWTRVQASASQVWGDDSSNPCKAHSTAPSMDTLCHGRYFCTFLQGLGLPTKLPTSSSPAHSWPPQPVGSLDKLGNWLEIALSLSSLSSSLGPGSVTLSLLPAPSRLCRHHKGSCWLQHCRIQATGDMCPLKDTLPCDSHQALEEKGEEDSSLCPSFPTSLHQEAGK